MKSLILLAALVAFPAHAACVGTTVRTCTDANGNSYTTTQAGNSSFTTGYSASTGNTWSQSSLSAGSNTYTYGTDADGNGWSSTTTPYGTLGVDSDGNSFFEPN